MTELILLRAITITTNIIRGNRCMRAPKADYELSGTADFEKSSFAEFSFTRTYTYIFFTGLSIFYFSYRFTTIYVYIR